MQRKSKAKSEQQKSAQNPFLLTERDFLNLEKNVLESQVKATDLLNDVLKLEIEDLKKQIKDLQSKERPEKERVMPSDALCFDCPFNKRCQLKGLGIPLCPQLTKMNNDYKNGLYSYVRYVDQCLQKEKIKLN